MPSEPNQKMDALLKAAAQKRRAETGGQFVPHPVTRDLLQAEVAKLRQEPLEPKSSWLNLLSSFWPRFAVGGAFVAALALTLFMRFQMAPESSTQLKLAQNSAADTLQVEQLNRSLPADHKARELSSEISGPSTDAPKELKLARAVAEKKATSTNQESNVALAKITKPAPQTGPVAARLDDASALIARGLSEAAGASGKLDVPRQLNAAATNSNARTLAIALPALATASRYQNQNLSSQSSTRYSLILPAQAGSTATANSPKRAEAGENQQRENLPSSPATQSAPIVNNSQVFLNTFTVEQVAGQLRVVDEDGSVYLGELLGGETNAPTALAANDVTLEAGRKDALARDKQKSEAEARAPSQPLVETKRTSGLQAPVANQAYFFRVSGTNRSLNQLLVFNGNFIVPTNELTLNEKLGASVAAVKPANNSAPVSFFHIQGQAQLGKNAPVDINAAPAER